MERDWWRQPPYYYWWRDVTELLPPGHGVCLDVGCGEGRQREVVEARGYQWQGIDVTRRGPAEVPVGLIVDGRFPVADGIADCLLCRQVLEHVEDLERFGAECARALKPGGLIYGSSSWLEPGHDGGGSFSNLGHQGLSTLLRRHGFEVVTVEAGIHAGVLLVRSLLQDRWASRLARAVAWAQRRADRREHQRPENAGVEGEALRKKQALRYAGHLLWVARKR
jgi:SAM-dependent methyltransferase